jgi:hypothetical protein
MDFTKRWSFEWEAILNAMGLCPDANVLGYRNRPDRDHYGAVDFRLSEVYRSAFLRSLGRAVETGAMKPEDARVLGLETCPIDLELWKLSPRPAPPPWWFSAPEPTGQIDTVPAEIWKQVEDLWKRQRRGDDEWVIVQASGRVHEGAAVYDIVVQGALQRSFGPTAPTAEEIVHGTIEQPLAQYRPIGPRFRGEYSSFPTSALRRTHRDWWVFPLARPFWPHVVDRWQSWRPERSIWLPTAASGANPLAFGVDEEGVWVECESNVVARWADWAYSFRELRDANLPSSTGECLVIKRNVLDDLLRDTRASFCWVCRLTTFHRKHEFVEYEKVETSRLFGGHGLILLPQRPGL